MFEMHAGGTFVNMLAAGTAAAGERFFEILFGQIARLHASGQRKGFSLCDTEVDQYRPL